MKVPRIKRNADGDPLFEPLRDLAAEERQARRQLQGWKEIEPGPALRFDPQARTGSERFDPNEHIDRMEMVFDFFKARRRLEQRFQLSAEPMTRSFVMTDELGGRHEIARFYEGVEEAAVMRSALIDYHVNKEEAAFERKRDA